MARAKIQEWSVSENIRKDDTVTWKLTRAGRHSIVLRFQPDMDDELMVRQAMNVIALAEDDPRNIRTETE